MKTRKKSYLILLCSITLLAVSCKREDFKKTDVVNNSSSEIKVEDGYLSFSSYENFMKVFLNISNLNSSDRVKWEKSIGFTSLGTIYDNFNSELQALEKSKPQDALQQYSRLKQKYAGQLAFTDSTYNLKCTGVRESFLANKDGIVKIGDEFIHFGVNGYETYKASAGKGYAGSVKVDAINGSQPNANSLTVTAGNYGMTSQGNGQFYARVKLYNVHTGAGGYRGFVALECYARHKNWIGIWADRKSLVGISGAVDLELIKGAANNPVSSTPFNALIGGSVFPPPPLGTPTPGTGNENLTERYEVVLALSQYLKTNAQPIFNVGNNIELGSNPAIVNDDFLQPLGYWKTAKSVEFKIPFAYTPIKINAMSGFDLLTNNITYPELILNF